MKKIIPFLALFLLTSFVAKSQIEYHHGIGANLLTALDSTGGGGYGVTYKARLNVAEVGDNGCISVSTYPGLGIGGSANSRTGGTFRFSYELPILASYNMGKFASEKSDGNVGFFAGVGYHIYGFGNSDDGLVKGTGVIGMVGARFSIYERPFEVNLSYTTGHNVVGARLIYLFEGK